MFHSVQADLCDIYYIYIIYAIFPQKFGLWFLFSVWLCNKWNSVWCQVSRRVVPFKAGTGSDCFYIFPIGFATSGVPFGAMSFGKVYLVGLNLVLVVRYSFFDGLCNKRRGVIAVRFLVWRTAYSCIVLFI